MLCCVVILFFKQKTAYEMRISDWSSDVCSSDLINVIAQVLSYDGECEPDMVAMVAASAALTLSGVPFMGPIAAARVGYVDGDYVLNPTNDQVKEGDLDLVVAGTHDAVLMVESEANELSEEVMLGAVMFAHRECQPVIDTIIKSEEHTSALQSLMRN